MEDFEKKKSVIEQIAEQLAPETGMPTLKAFAVALDIPYPRLRAVSKQPEEGMVYDAHAFNYYAISRFITRRLDPENGFASLEEVVSKAIEIDKELKEQDGRRAPSIGKKIITLSDGTQIPARRYNFELGDKTTIKKDESGKVYEVVYITISHIVLRVVGSEELYCMSNNTANWRLTPPIREPEPAEDWPAEEST